jgi:hypothetical protein
MLLKKEEPFIKPRKTRSLADIFHPYFITDQTHISSQIKHTFGQLQEMVIKTGGRLRDG